jgi:histidinol dehydrogenase
MNAVPAQVAGVEEIVVVSPCSRRGQVDDAVLATCAELAIREVYRVGGAQAVAALAFGTASIRRVDKIVGGANIFVSLAKKEVFGLVDVGFIAGPSEVLVLADDSADAAFVAADLVGQSEHNPGSAILVTTSEEFARAVAAQVEKQLTALPRPEDARRSLAEFGLLVVTEDLKQAATVANQVAPEHLQVTTRDDEMVLRLVRNAGTILVGPYSSVAASDYMAGPSHVLPTGGGARFASGLTARDFVKSTSVVRLTRTGLAEAGDDIRTLAEAEGLAGHARSVSVRLEAPGDVRERGEAGRPGPRSGRKAGRKT